jgi:hypothetical protein
MKTAAGLFLVSFILCGPGVLPAQQDPGDGAVPSHKEAVAGVRKATISIALCGNRKAVLDYSTISARHEIPSRPGLSENPEGRAFYEQIMSQRLLQSRLLIENTVTISGITLEPGRYGVGLSGFKDGNFDLAVFKDRERFKIPLVMDPAPFDSPYVTFSFASRGEDELALIFHAGKKCAHLPVKVVVEKKDGGEEDG